MICFFRLIIIFSIISFFQVSMANLLTPTCTFEFFDEMNSQQFEYIVDESCKHVRNRWTYYNYESFLFNIDQHDKSVDLSERLCGVPKAKQEYNIDFNSVSYDIESNDNILFIQNELLAQHINQYFVSLSVNNTKVAGPTLKVFVGKILQENMLELLNESLYYGEFYLEASAQYKFESKIKLTNNLSLKVICDHKAKTASNKIFEDILRWTKRKNQELKE